MLPVVQAALGDKFLTTAAPMTAQVGSGALPADGLPSFGLRVERKRGARSSLQGLEARLRELPRPVIGRIADRALWLDLRCLEAADEAEFIAQWSELGR